MRKISVFAAILLAAAILTGCTYGGEIYPKSSSMYIPSSSAEQSSSTTTSTSSSSTSTKAAYVPEIPLVKENVFVMSFDPTDGRKVEFDGLTVKISGKLPPEGISHIEINRQAETKLEENGDEFTAVVTYLSEADGFTTLKLREKSGSAAIYRFKISSGKIVMPSDVEGVAEKNASLAKKAIEMPLEQVSEYVSIGSDPEKVKNILAEIQKLSDTICEGITEDYDKLRAISAWIAGNIYYDYPAFNRGVPEDTLTLEYILENKSSVCGGFSNLTAALAAAQGIQVYNVHGSAAEGAYCFEEEPIEEVHEWTFAVIGGRTVWLDPDFDSRNYFRGVGYYQSGKPITKYYDINGELLALTHRGKYAEHRDYFALLGGN